MQTNDALLDQIDALLHLAERGALTPPVPHLALELLQASRAALASHEPAPTDTQEGVEWQPIETAPKGSEMFLAYAPPSNDFPDGRTIIVKGSILASMMAEGTPNHLAFPATLWMPLPVPSATGEQQ